MQGMASRRLAGWLIVATGMGFVALSTVGDSLRLGQPFLSPDYRPAPTFADALPHLPTDGLLALAAAGLLALLFSRAVPRWWSLAYAVLALALVVAIISWGADIAIEFTQRLQAAPDDTLFAVRPRRPAHYLVIGCRLVLGVVATLAIAAPLLRPPRPARRPPDVPQQPLGLQA
jgi:hypothetical protein